MGWSQRFRASWRKRAELEVDSRNTPSISMREEQALPSTTLGINGVKVRTHSYGDVRRVLYTAQLQF